MTTDWKKEVEAKAHNDSYWGRSIEVEDALALLERCRMETLEEVKALNVIALLREQVERRSQALQNPNPGGQHVPDHSDFSHAQPSTITRLQWYLRAFDAEVESLASKGGGK